MITNEFDEIILSALKEDIQSGDITTAAIIPNGLNAKGVFLVKQNGIIAGLKIVQRVFNLVNKSLYFEAFIKDGTKVSPGVIAAKVEGKASSILTAERTALNFLQRSSGIATIANRYQSIIKHTKAKILDTRKTAPGLRFMDKLAVKLGGCENHRFGLYDMFLIKDNHIEVAGSITKAIQLCKDFNEENDESIKIEVEVDNLNQLKEALNCNVDIILIDNFNLEDMKEAVNITAGKCKIEASGNINLENVKQVAETGVDYISVGALTHSVKALDISLEVTLL
jgi:nicotinate-nucleotide pyrophosphorylase (carboxylating)